MSGEDAADLPPIAPEIAADGFFACDLRVARILAAEPNPKARVPAYVLRLDLGPFGERTSSAQLTARYRPEDLVGRTVIVAANLGSRRVAGVKSEVLVLGAPDDEGRTALLDVDAGTPPGSRVH